MTQQADFLEKINNLPPHYIREAIDFVGYLQYKAQQEAAVQNNEIEQKQQPKERRGFGCAKGQIWMADDFDAPLDDFKDYM